MDYIELQNILPGWVFVAGWIGAPLFLAIALVLFLKGEKSSSPKKRMTSITVGYFMALPIIGSMLLAHMTTVPNAELRRDQLTAEVTATYGIDLRKGEARELNYPRERPTKEFEAFGSFERMLPDGDGGYELNRIFLLWEDGEMKLAKSTDGESFTPLGAKS